METVNELSPSPLPLLYRRFCHCWLSTLLAACYHRCSPLPALLPLLPLAPAASTATATITTPSLSTIVPMRMNGARFSPQLPNLTP